MYVLVSASDSFSSRLNTGAQCKWGSVFYWLIFSSCDWCWVFIVIELLNLYCLFGIIELCWRTMDSVIHGYVCCLQVPEVRRTKASS